MKRNTGEEILLAALHLFAQNGYEGTGMRDIAAALGIRQSSLYKHFSGKQAIFDAVVAAMNERYRDAAQQLGMPQGTFAERAGGYGHAAPADIQQLAEALFRYWTEDDYASAFRRMLAQEQYRSPAAAKLYYSYFLEATLAYNTSLFAEMIRQGWFAEGDARHMAMAFYGPIFMMMTGYDSADAAQRAAMPAQVAAYVADFGRRYARQNKQEEKP